MILAAGLGTRLLPLSALRAKPAMPVLGVPVIASPLSLLARHGFEEVVINLHHLPETVRDAVERHKPPGLGVRYSHEESLLGTGGAIKSVADFLRQSEPSVVLAGDMLLDFDLTSAIARHRERGDRYTLMLRADDPHAASFGTIGIDDEGSVRRIGEHFDLGGETRAALFTGVRIVSAEALSGFLPEAAFEDLRDWQAPKLERGARDIRAEIVPADSYAWQPVGTPAEYLAANFPPTAKGPESVFRGEGAVVDPTAELERVVIWPGEHVAAGTRAQNGIFAGGRFHSCDNSSHEAENPDALGS